MRNFLVKLPIIVAFLLSIATRASADPTPPVLGYGAENFYLTDLKADIAEINRRAHPGCKMPFFVSREMRNLPLTIHVRNDTTRESVVVGIKRVGFKFEASCAIELVDPLLTKTIDLKRHRIFVTLDALPLIQDMFIHTNPFFAWVEGTVAETLNISIRLESVKNAQKYCPVVYTMVGKRISP